MGTKKVPERDVLRKMISRCHDEEDDNYKYYGARGISVCKEWRDSFESFIAHIGKRPPGNMCIDRIDNDRGYEPGNVRWATRKQNQRNTRLTTMVDLWGCKVPLNEIADLFQINNKTLRHRIFNLGMTWQEAIRARKGPWMMRHAASDVATVQ